MRQNAQRIEITAERDTQLGNRFALNGAHKKKNANNFQN